MILKFLKELFTVELGYNNHGYNEFMAITNNCDSTFLVQMIILLHKPSRL
jgi:hypothetical protein